MVDGGPCGWLARRGAGTGAPGGAACVGAAGWTCW